jgi:hypothetical protein
LFSSDAEITLLPLADSRSATGLIIESTVVFVPKKPAGKSVLIIISRIRNTLLYWSMLKLNPCVGLKLFPLLYPKADPLLVRFT